MTKHRLTARSLADEQGWVLVSATILSLLMLSIGLVAAGLIDNGTKRTREQRERESALNVNEGVLYSQSLVMQTAWPSSAGNDPITSYPQYYPVTCASSGGNPGHVKHCPNAASLVAAGGTPGSAVFGNVDQLKDVTWSTKVRDNGGELASSYDPLKADLTQGAGCPIPAALSPTTACTYDANKDRELWVQSQAIVRGKPRNVVARLRLEQLAESIPQSAVTSGAVKITNLGNHGGTPIIDATGSQVIVRCANAADSSCADFQAGQIVPGSPQSDATAPNLMTADQLQRFKQRAVIDGTYYAGCPVAPWKLSGKVVWVEGCTSPPNLTSKIPTTPCGAGVPPGLDPDCVNSESDPGLLIWHCGLADMAGGWTFRGLLYIANNSDGTCAASMPQRGNGTCSNTPNTHPTDAITTNGGFGVWGVVAVDGPACLKLGSNGVQIGFDKRVFDASESYGTVGLVQNTWRELNPRDF